MKKTYVAPNLEIELYELNASIANNCATVVNMGDYGGGSGEPACNDYLDLVGKLNPDSPSPWSRPHNVSFWENTCDCYTTASGDGYFTS